MHLVRLLWQMDSSSRGWETILSPLLMVRIGRDVSALFCLAMVELFRTESSSSTLDGISCRFLLCLTVTFTCRTLWLTSALRTRRCFKLFFLVWLDAFIASNTCLCCLQM